MLTTREAGDRLGIKGRSVAKLINLGMLKAHKRGRDWFIEEVEVERYAKERNPPHRPTTQSKAREEDT